MCAEVSATWKVAGNRSDVAEKTEKTVESRRAKLYACETEQKLRYECLFCVTAKEQLTSRRIHSMSECQNHRGLSKET